MIIECLIQLYLILFQDGARVHISLLCLTHSTSSVIYLCSLCHILVFICVLKLRISNSCLVHTNTVNSSISLDVEFTCINVFFIIFPLIMCNNLLSLIDVNCVICPHMCLKTCASAIHGACVQFQLSLP